MLDLYQGIINNVATYRQFRCGETLFTMYNCPLEKKYEDAWSQHNYIVYVMEGRKVWHTAHGSYDLRKGSCVFVRKVPASLNSFLIPAFA